MESLLGQFVGRLLPPALAGVLVVVLARLLAIGWLRDQREFREQVQKHIEATRTYPEFRARTEDRLRKLYELELKASSLGADVANVKADLTALRGDVKEGIRELKSEIDKLGEKLDDIFRRAFGAKG